MSDFIEVTTWAGSSNILSKKHIKKVSQDDRGLAIIELWGNSYQKINTQNSYQDVAKELCENSPIAKNVIITTDCEGNNYYVPTEHYEEFWKWCESEPDGDIFEKGTLFEGDVFVVDIVAKYSAQ